MADLKKAKALFDKLIANAKPIGNSTSRKGTNQSLAANNVTDENTKVEQTIPSTPLEMIYANHTVLLDTTPEQDYQEESTKIADVPALELFTFDKSNLQGNQNQHEKVREKQPEKPPQKPPEKQANKLIEKLKLSKFTPTFPEGVEFERIHDDVFVLVSGHEYRIKNLYKNLSSTQLLVNIKLTIDSRSHIDNVDFYSSNQRKRFIKEASVETLISERLISDDLAKLLNLLEILQQEEIYRQTTPQKHVPEMSESEKDAAMQLLKSQDLAELIMQHSEECGIVGEGQNFLLGYLVCTSRLLQQPLALIIQSNSGAGKSSLMDALLEFMPDENRVKFTSMSGKSLYYLERHALKNNILAVVEQVGAVDTMYALKMLQSEGELKTASAGKDPVTGKLLTNVYHVEGPAPIIMTATIKIEDEEFLNRCLIIAVNESREQTRRIQNLQRKLETINGLWKSSKTAELTTLHQNAQRLLRPLVVINPYAEQLSFIDDKTRTRRDHVKYLTLIKCIALLFQHQRAIKSETRNGETIEYIEVMLSDIKLANRLANEVLGRSLDELAPQERNLLIHLEIMVRDRCKELGLAKEDCMFTLRDVMDYMGWSYKQTQSHLLTLVQHEYVLAHRSSRGQRNFYELLYDGKGKDGNRFVIGLIDVVELESNANETTSSFNNFNSNSNSERYQRVSINPSKKG